MIARYYVCAFCEEETNEIVGFVATNERSQTQKADETLKLCLSCFEENTGNKIETEDRPEPIVNANTFCMYCQAICWASGNTKKCAIEVSHRWVQYRICNNCWKRERDL